MARGFGTTLGSGSTDRIETTLTTKPTQRSYHIWANINGQGGASNGRMFQAAGDYSLVLLGTGIITYQRKWSTTDGLWHITQPAASTWFGLGVSYNAGLAGDETGNEPLMYVNGISQTITEDSNPNGTLGTTTGAYSIGNDGGGIRNWDGMLAEFAVWDALLDAAEFAALGKGYSPLLIRPASLVEHVPMVRDNISRKLAAPTITGTAVQPHPRIIMPRKWRGAARLARPPPPETLFAQACL
jgi:hypothetical protein